MSYGDDGGDVFLGRDFATRRDYSESTQQEIDAEVTRLLHDNYADAKRILEENRAVLDRIASALLERETLESADMERLVAGQPLPPLPVPSETAPGGEASSEPEPKEFPPGDKLPDPEPIPS